MATVSNPGKLDNSAAALWYARRGLPVFRLVPRSKSPYAGSHGHLDATTDATQVDAWWREHPAANIGLYCAAAGVVVTDVDHRRGGDEHDLGTIPDTWRVLMPGGSHVFFGVASSDLQVCGTLTPGIDVKYHGFVMLPPSIHPSGRRYRWEIGCAPTEIALARLPEALAARIVDDGGHDGGRLHKDGTALVIPEGERNVTLFRIGCALRRRGVADPALTLALAAINAHQTARPLDARELARIAASCLRYAPGAR